MHSFGAQIPDFPSKFQNQFYSYSLTLRSQHLQPLQFLKNMIRRTPMGDISRPSNYGCGGPENGFFIQCVNGREPQIQELWCWDIYRICREVHPTARVDLLAGTVRQFFTEFLFKNGRRNWIIVEFSINGSVKFIRFSEIWGSILLYIPNIMAQVEAIGWVSRSNDSSQ